MMDSNTRESIATLCSARIAACTVALTASHLARYQSTHKCGYDQPNKRFCKHFQCVPANDLRSRCLLDAAGLLFLHTRRQELFIFSERVFFAETTRIIDVFCLAGRRWCIHGSNQTRDFLNAINTYGRELPLALVPGDRQLLRHLHQTTFLAATFC